VRPGADLGFYKGGCPIHPKGAPVVERRRRRWGDSPDSQWRHWLSGVRFLVQLLHFHFKAKILRLSLWFSQQDLQWFLLLDCGAIGMFACSQM